MTIIWRDQYDSERFQLGTQHGGRITAWTTLSDEALTALFGGEVRRAAERLDKGDILPVFIEGSVRDEEEEEYAGQKPF